MFALQAMHAGVVRDMEQQRIKKERQLDFEIQRALEEQYRKVQQVHDGGQAGEVVDKPR
jgi:protein PET117